MHPNNVLIMQHYFLMNYGSQGMEHRCRRPKNIQENEFTPFHWFFLELKIHSSTAPRRTKMYLHLAKIINSGLLFVIVRGSEHRPQ